MRSGEWRMGRMSRTDVEGKLVGGRKELFVVLCSIG